MKRNNIFMWAYIVFIFVASILRLFVAYDFWNSIVIAVTISSMVFAFEDLYVRRAKFYNSSKENLQTIYSQAKKHFDRSKEYIEEATAVLNEVKALNVVLPESFLTLQIPDSSNEKAQETFNSLKEMISKLEKDAKKFKKTAYIFAFIGFFCLFSFLVICELCRIPLIIQELITVFSFAIILLTQQLSVIMNEKLEEELLTCEDITTSTVEFLEKMKLYKSNLDSLKKKIENSKKKKEIE